MNERRVSVTVADNSKEIERRTAKRLSLSMPITLLNQKFETKNISSNGVYFEATTSDSDTETYSPGKTYKFEIETDGDEPTINNRKVRLIGIGVAVRVEIKRINQNRNKLGVGMRFKKPLDLYLFK